MTFELRPPQIVTPEGETVDNTESRGLRIGSLFSGYGGLDLGVQQVLGGSVAWHVEFDAAPSAYLLHGYAHLEDDEPRKEEPWRETAHRSGSTSGTTTTSEP